MDVRRKGLLVTALGLLIGSYLLDIPSFDLVTTNKDGLSPRLSAARQTHILYGDRNGGGHKAGLGKPCKSEFPDGWGDGKIVDTVLKVAANDNLRWKEQDNGYYVAEQPVDGVRVRVVLDKERDDIITAYPVNVPRNPCTAPANDNARSGQPQR